MDQGAIPKKDTTAANNLDWGIPLHEVTIKTGLRELCPGLHFDMLTKIGQVHPNQLNWQGVFYQGRHICSMDRGGAAGGLIFEIKVWDQVDGVVEIPMSDFERPDDSRVIWWEIPPGHKDYEQAFTLAEHENDNFYFEAGKVKARICIAEGKVRGPCRFLGWRHTFEKLLAANLPGVTRESLSKKFKIDMFKYPAGPPEESWAALHEE